MKNIELKATCGDLTLALRQASLMGAVPTESMVHVDTYFEVPYGRFKLREFRAAANAEVDWPGMRTALPDSGAAAQLIPYVRDDEAGPRLSSYETLTVKRPDDLKALLARMFGILGVVRKARLVCIFMNVRIHLDEVDGIGSFVELEAVMDAEHADERAEREKLDAIATTLGLGAADLVEGSYIDLLLASQRR